MKLIGVRSEVRQVTFFVVELDLEIASSQLCRKFLPLARNAIEIQGLYYFASHSLTAFVQACQEKVCVCFFIHSFIHSFFLSFILSFFLFICLRRWVVLPSRPMAQEHGCRRKDWYLIFLIDFDRGRNKFLHPERGAQPEGVLNCHSGEMPAVLQWLQR